MGESSAFDITDPRLGEVPNLDRRSLIAALLAAPCFTAPWGATAQPSGRPRRIGFITLRSGPSDFDRAFRDALEELGYIEGSNILIDYRWAAENEQRATDFAAELVARNVEVIVAATTGAIRAALRATTTVPIVMAAAADPIASGLVASLARPGGNVTGLTLTSNDTGQKRLQLVRELVPAATRVAIMLVDRGLTDDAPINARLLEQLQSASDQLGLALIIVTVANVSQIAEAFERFRGDSAEALMVPVNSMVIDERHRIIQLAAEHRLPAVFEADVFVAAGALLSYGPSIAAMYRRAASFVDRILKGSLPGDLPIEQPTAFRLTVNLKTAAALGLVIAPSILHRADEVIE